MRLQALVSLVSGRLVPPAAPESSGQTSPAPSPRPSSRVGETPVLGAAPLYETAAGLITMVHGDGADPNAITPDTAAAVVTGHQLTLPVPQIVCQDPHRAFGTIVALFRPSLDAMPIGDGVSPRASIDSTANIHRRATVADDVTIDPRAAVGPGSVIMPGCHIGADVVIGPNVTLYPHTRIGDRCIIAAGCVIGSRGFGFRPGPAGHVASAQLGYVVLEDDVELGASVTVDRGTYGSTRIGRGTKIDNQVMIAHNCQIGRYNLICSQVGIAGSCETGDHVILAGQVGVKDHVRLGDGVIVGAQAGVMEDLAGGQVYLGSPCTVQREQLQIMASQRRLPELRRELKRLQRTVEDLRTNESPAAGHAGTDPNPTARTDDRRRAA